MHAHLTDVLARLDATHDDMRAAVAAVPRELRGRRPEADRWSVAEVVEHLALAEKRFSTMVATAVEPTRSGLGPELDAREPLPERVEGLLANRESRRQAPEVIQPTGQMDEAQAWAALDRARGEFRTLLESLDGLALGQVYHEHPLMGRLNVYQWVELVAGHEARHIAQIREIATVFASAH